MKKTLLLVLFILGSMPIFASHVVGGDISVQWVAANDYIIKVQVYRDDVNGALGMPTDLNVGIYKIGTNFQQLLVTIPLTTSSIVDLGDHCYRPDANVVSIEEGIYISTVVTIPNFAAGYYLHTQLYSRNDLSINLLDPDTYGMSFFAEIPDPALGQNSTPEFGVYPADAYFCVSKGNITDYSVIDIDGDSLVYSLVDPLSSSGTNNGTVAGSGAYPYYPAVPWDVLSGYSLVDICGGSLPMQIDAVTGILTAEPIVQSFFVFAIRVEEYRGGIKIGEIRRDVEYASLNCVSIPPVFNIPAVIELPVFTGVNSVSDGCVDMLINDINGNGIDTFYLSITSPNFDVPGNYVAPDFFNGQYFYENFNNTTDTLWIPYRDSIDGMMAGLSGVATRFCWEPTCEELQTTYLVNVVAFIDGCNGLDSAQQTISLNVVNNLPDTLNFNFPSMNSLLPQQIDFENLFCFDVFGEDETGSGLTVSMLPINANFDYIEGYVEPILLNGDYYYNNMNGADTLWLLDYDYSSGTGLVQTIGKIAARYCWNFDCEDLLIKSFDIEYEVSTGNCGETYAELGVFHLDVLPPEDDVLVGMPNVFTPNGDNENDMFRMKAFNISDSSINAVDECNDFMSVSIYNRWGVLVFESENPYFEWDGKNKGGNNCAEGAYSVIIFGEYGSTYNALTGERIPNIVKDQYTVQLFR